MLSNHPNVLGGNGPSASSDLIGDVDGPASATDNAVARFDGTTGKLIQNSVVTIADTTGAIAGAQSLTSPASTNLTLGLGTGGTALTLENSTLSATFGGNISIVRAGDNPRMSYSTGTDSSIIGMAGEAAGLVVSSIAGDIVLRTAASRSIRFTCDSGDTNTAVISSAGLSIASATAGSAGAGALVVAGGISAGQSAQASYFGGAVTATGTLTSTGASQPQLSLTKTGSGAGTFSIYNDGNSHIASAGGTLYINNSSGAAVNFGGAATFAGAVTAPSATILDAAASTTTVLTVRTQNSTTYSSSVLTIIGDRGTTDSTYNLINANNNVISGQFLVRDSGNVVNTNNSYGAISDIRLKENIVDATSKLEKLNQVRIVNFNRIGNEQKQLGVIAQELEQIFPSMIEEAIDRDAEGNDLGTTTKSVKYSVFVPMLIKAMQELTARLAAVEAK